MSSATATQKNYVVEAIDKVGKRHLYLKEKLPKINDVEIEEGIFDAPQGELILKIRFLSKTEIALGQITKMWFKFSPKKIKLKTQ